MNKTRAARECGHGAGELKVELLSRSPQGRGGERCAKRKAGFAVASHIASSSRSLYDMCVCSVGAV